MESGHVPRRLDKFECTGPRCPDKAKMSGHDEVSRHRGVEVLFFSITVISRDAHGAAIQTRHSQRLSKK